MKKAKSFGYIMDIPLYAQKLADSKRAASAQSEKISDIASNFMQAKKFKSENFERIADELSLQQKVLDRLQRSVEFYEACLMFTVYWATREQLKLALVAMLKDEKFKKVRPHHKKFEAFMQDNFPKLSIYESNGYLEADIKSLDIDYKFKKHGNVYLNCTYDEPIYMHNEKLKAFVENTELPTEPTEKIVGRYIEAKRKHKKLMEATKAKVASIKSEIGYSVFQFQDSLQESDNFNF